MRSFVNALLVGIAFFAGVWVTTSVMKPTDSWRIDADQLVNELNAGFSDYSARADDLTARIESLETRYRDLQSLVDSINSALMANSELLKTLSAVRSNSQEEPK